jgi:hypothetical protein
MSRMFSAVLDRTPPRGPASPPAARLQRRWWRDTRVLVGAGLIIVCTLAGARVMSMGTEEVRVWQVARDLAAGAPVTAGDLEVVSVTPELADAYAAADVVPGGRLTRDVSAGEMLPVAALAAGVGAEVRWVAVPIEPLHAPADLAPGNRVDVWATADPARNVAAPANPTPLLVLANALVASIDVEARGFAGDYGVVLEVSPQDAETVLAAVRGASIDLVRVPVGAPS